MMKRVMLVSLGLVLVLALWMTVYGNEKPLILPISDVQEVSPPLSRAACQLTNFTGPIAYYTSMWQPGWRFVELFDPDDCGTPPTYPFEITSLDVSLYDDGAATWPCTLAVIVWDVGGSDSCYYPATELCRQYWVCEEALFTYPAVGSVSFGSPCCVDGPVFVGVEYGGAAGVQQPSIVWEDPPVDTCDAWVDTSGTGAWTIQSQIFNVGYTMWWVNGETDSPNCADSCNWQIGDPYKMHFPQLPDTMGWDVCATSPVQLADDWMCSETGWVQDIHFWGGWKNDLIGDIQQFNITIYEDIPANQSPTGYSMPGATLWWGEFPGDDVTGYEPASLEGWYNPNAAGGGIVIPNSIQMSWQYAICMDSTPWCWQDSGTVYWLGIEAFVADDAFKWGWKSSVNHWNDDAVWDSTGGNFWQELYEPGSAGWDTLFNFFYVVMDEGGQVIDGGGEEAYGVGWYFYPWYDWWNIWFYDHPFDTSRYKTGFIDFDIFPYAGGPMWLEIAVNWSTDIWAWEGDPERPPLPGEDEDLFIGREVLFASDFAEGHYTLPYEIPMYNPEWVSVDIRGFNFIIPQGVIVHECRPKVPGPGESLDLSFVITGEAVVPQYGACCDTFGNCYTMNAADCAAMGGLYEGDGTSCTPNPCDSCDFQYPGDVNNDGAHNIVDLVWLLDYLYRGGSTPPVIANADVNGDCCIDWRDVKYLVMYLFIGGPQPVNCTCVHPQLCLPAPADHTPGKVYHNVDGFRPPFGPPNGTSWHELYPNFCTDWVLIDWMDNGNGYLDSCDYIIVTNGTTNREEHVIEVMPTLTLLDSLAGDTVYMDLIDPSNPMVDPMGDALGSQWHQVYPNYCRKYQLVYWPGMFFNAPIAVGDDIWMQGLSGPDSTLTKFYRLLAFETDMITERETCCLLRGDVDHNGTGPDIADLVYMVNFMFNGGPQPPCEEPLGSNYFPECDVNGDGTGPDIADLVYLVNYMFNGGPAPVPCP